MNGQWQEKWIFFLLVKKNFTQNRDGDYEDLCADKCRKFNLGNFQTEVHMREFETVCCWRLRMETSLRLVV